MPARSETDPAGGSQTRPEIAITSVPTGLDDPFGFMTRSSVMALSLTRVLCSCPPTLMGPLGGGKGKKEGGGFKGMRQLSLAVCALYEVNSGFSLHSRIGLFPAIQSSELT